jgi:hypothetical protein
LKPVEVILRKETEQEGKSWRDEPNWGVIYLYMEITWRNLLYNYLTIKC